MGRHKGYFTYRGRRRVSSQRGIKAPPTNRNPLRSVSVTPETHEWITAQAKNAGVSVRVFADALVLDALRRAS